MADTNNLKDFEEKIFRYKWLVQNWNNPSETQSLLAAKTDLHLKLEDVEYAIFSVRTSHSRPNWFLFGWTLLSKNTCLKNVEVKLVAEILRSDGKTVQYEVQAVTLIGKEVTVSEPILNPALRNPDNATWFNSEGNVEIRLICTLKAISSSELNEFKTKCLDEFSLNLAAALEDSQTSDVKIRTKDNVDLLAHIVILQARCPVFASMFRSGFKESTTGLVKVSDISAKVMKMLLNYWYTGQLQPSWRNKDTILEFMYAAEKYQITPVLQMLNNFLGRVPKDSDLDVGVIKDDAKVIPA